MHSSLSPELPVLPVGAGAMVIATSPCVGDCGRSRPVVGSIDGPLVPEDDEPDLEPETVGCIQAANSMVSTTKSALSGAIFGGFNVIPFSSYAGIQRKISGIGISSTPATTGFADEIKDVRYRRAAPPAAAATIHCIMLQPPCHSLAIEAPYTL